MLKGAYKLPMNASLIYKTRIEMKDKAKIAKFISEFTEDVLDELGTSNNIEIDIQNTDQEYNVFIRSTDPEFSDYRSFPKRTK